MGPIHEYGMFGIPIWLRIECIRNRFLTYIDYVLKLDHPPYDNSIISTPLNIQTLFYLRIEADQSFKYPLS